MDAVEITKFGNFRHALRVVFIDLCLKFSEFREGRRRSCYTAEMVFHTGLFARRAATV
jgi:hypothetical protein